MPIGEREGKGGVDINRRRQPPLDRAWLIF